MPAARPCSCPAGPFCLSCRCSHTDSGRGPRPLPGLLLSSVAVTVLTHSRRLSRVGHRQDEQTRGGGAPRSTPRRPRGKGVIRGQEAGSATSRRDTWTARVHAETCEDNARATREKNATIPWHTLIPHGDLTSGDLCMNVHVGNSRGWAHNPGCPPERPSGCRVLGRGGWLAAGLSTSCPCPMVGRKVSSS